MKKLLPLLFLLSLPVAADDTPAPRVFDIVEPVAATGPDGYSELRQQGTRFGAIVAFAPGSAGRAWIPLAVLNTGSEPLAIGTRHVTARAGEMPLAVWTAAELADDIRARGGDAARGSRGVTGPAPGSSEPGGAVAPVNPGSPSGENRTPDRQMPTVDAGQITNRPPTRAQILADAQVQLQVDRLLKDEELAPQTFARGEVLLDLPPPRTDGQPAEFVLTLAFGGETMDVRYREREEAETADPAN